MKDGRTLLLAIALLSILPSSFLAGSPDRKAKAANEKG